MTKREQLGKNVKVEIELTKLFESRVLDMKKKMLEKYETMARERHFLAVSFQSS